MRVESKFVQTVALDPIIAALLGISGSPQILHSITYVPDLAGRLSRTYRTGVLYVSGGHSVNPGNGVFVTSTISTVIGGYSYTGLRRWSFGASGEYDWANSIGTITGDYSSRGGSLLMSREITRNMHFVFSYSVRQYRSAQYVNYDRNVSDARASIGYSPGDIPIRVW